MFHQWDFTNKNLLTDNIWGLSQFDHLDSIGLKINSNSTSPATFSIESKNLKNVHFWAFEIEIKGTLSTSNYARIYLSSNEKNLIENHSGYHIQIDGTKGQHFYKLYKQVGAKRTTLFTSAGFTSRTTHYTAKIYVRRTDLGLWSIEAEEYNSGTNQVILPQDTKLIDNSVDIGNFLGILFSFTSTRKKDFIAKSVAFEEKEETPLPEEIPDLASEQDVIFNEIMANPKGNTTWPDIEFIELYNRSTDSLWINDWMLSTKSSKVPFGAFWLAPKSYVILCKDVDTSSFEDSGRVIGLKKWPTLPNTGTELTIKNSKGITIDSVNYSDKWHSQSSFRQGGVSLERIFLEDRCALDSAWSSSQHKAGATPNKPNSISTSEILSIEISKFEIIHDTLIRIQFTKKINAEDVAIKTSLTQVLENQSIVHKLNQPNSNTLLIELTKPLIRSTNYLLTIQTTSNCDQNNLDLTHPFLIPETIKQGSLLISEILFDAFPGGSDFVEIHNPTQNILDLIHLSIATINNQGKRTSITRVSQTSKLIHPGEFAVLSTSPEDLPRFYPKSKIETFIKMASIPSFPNEQGYVLLLNNQIQIDSMYYNKKQHHALIKNTKGVSLERVSFDFADSQQVTWVSGPTQDGGASPGYKSIFKQQLHENSIEAQNRLFYPNTREYKEPYEFSIAYNLMEAQVMANVYVINYQGVKIKKILSHKSIPNSGKIIWDGTMENGQIAKTGIYTIMIELYNAEGWQLKSKKTCFLGFSN